MKEPFSIEFAWDCSSIVLGFDAQKTLRVLFGWLLNSFVNLI